MRKLHKIELIVLVLISFGLFITKSTSAPNDILNVTKYSAEYDPVKTIVIDAGHGGKDSGCLGSVAKEKDITLEVALKVGQLLQENHPKIKVLFTRTKDVFIPLHERTAMANRNHADLFVSIHCNASKRKEAKGTETFVMGLHKSEENLEIAKRENQVVLMEDDYKANYGGYDPNSPEAHIILCAYQNKNLENSIAIAAIMEEEMSKGGIKASRGVKQAGFVVLRTATMPSILIEAGFLTNPEDETKLNSKVGKKELAESIYNGILRYIEHQKNKPISRTETAEITKPVNYNRSKYTIINQAPKKATNLDPEIRYAVQIAATKENIDLAKKLNKPTLDYWVVYEKDMYKYLSGNFMDLPTAYEHREKLVSKGFKGAFLYRYNPKSKTVIEKAK